MLSGLQEGNQICYFVSAFGDKEKYLELGRGKVILKENKIVSGASSFSRYNEGLYPSWDAQNRISVHLAEKLGYEYDHEYVAYEVAGERRTH